MSPETKIQQPPLQRLREWYNRTWPHASSQWVYAWRTRKLHIIGSLGALLVVAIIVMCWPPQGKEAGEASWWMWLVPCNNYNFG